MKTTESEIRRSRLLFEAARSAWERMAPLRRRRRRYCRFTYGRQWDDPVRSREGEILSEGDLALRSGQQPLTNNLIRRLVKAVIGRFRMERAASPEATASADPSGLNRLDELDARTLEEFLISGMAVHRICREKRMEGFAAWADNIPPDRFFVNRMTDCRGGDLELAGCLRDMSPAEAVMRFAQGSPRRAEQLRKLFGAISPATASLFDDDPAQGDISFSQAAPGRCRVIEVWSLESRERYRCHDPLNAVFRYISQADLPALKKENGRRRRKGVAPVESRWEVATVWRCRMFAPDGTVLDSFDSPLSDGSLPYAIKLYPLVDGEVHSLVEDVIDQQKHVNRLITLMDHIMGVSAKGVLLFPTQCKVEGQSWKNIASQWAEPGSIIPYRPFDGSEPHQISSPVTDIGARDMLQTQIKLFEDVSGVSSTLMGKNISGAVGAERYESELRNSAVSILDLMQTFADFIAVRNRLLAHA